MENYEEYKKEYYSLLRDLTKYSPNAVGCAIFSERLGKLVDENVEFADRLENEELAGAYRAMN